MKEFNDAGSKMNQIGAMSKSHQNAEDEDYMQSVFDTYHKEGKDKRGNSNGNMILNKEGAWNASNEIIMIWYNLPELNANKNLVDKFDKAWSKFDINN